MSRKEKILVAFSGRNYLVLEASGYVSENDLEDVGPTELFGDIADPDIGLQIWEGVPHASVETLYEDHDGYEVCYDSGEWRKPTTEELEKYQSLKVGERMWPSFKNNMPCANEECDSEANEDTETFGGYCEECAAEFLEPDSQPE